MGTLSADERWDLIEKISAKTVKFGAYKPTLKDAIAEVTVKPLTGIPLAIAVLFGFWMFFCDFAGTLFTDGFLVELFDEHFLPWIQGAFPGKDTWLYYIFVGDPVADNCFEAFGMLTSGLFIAIAIVLPAVVAFYLILGLLEDVGYMPRLAVLIDTLLHKIGLHGYAIVPTLLSLGCNVPGVSATRVLETRKQRFIMLALLGVFVPCGAQIGVMSALIPELIGWVFLILGVGYIVFGYVLFKLIPGDTPEILIDVPPYQRPRLSNIAWKLWLRVSRFLFVALPFVFLGCVIVAIMYLTGAMDALSTALTPLLSGWFGVPSETVTPLIAAFLRKDLAVALLSEIEMTPYQMITSVVLVTIYFPCLATFVVLLKEENWKEFLGTLAFLAAMIFLYGGLLHLIGILLRVA
jgi:ferrous iron transport protein B